MAPTDSSPITTPPYNDSIPDSTLLTLHPELKAAIDKHGPPLTVVPNLKTIQRMRKGVAAANKRFNSSKLARDALGVTDPEDSSQRYWSESDHHVRVRDGTDIPIRMYKPKSLPQSGVPVVVLMHGGGWVMGDLNTEATLARYFCVKLGVLVVNVAFRNYPEAKFGGPVQDCYDVIRWTSTHARSHGGNCELGFVLAGVSGGGVCATICAHLARDDELTPRITGQWLSCPVLPGFTGNAKTGEVWDIFDTRTVNRSWVQCKDAPLMNEAMSDAVRTFTHFELDSKWFTPFLFESHGDLGSGGVYVQVAGIDPWRDVGRAYQGLCERAGNRTKLEVYAGMYHCWWTSYPNLRITQKWLEDSKKGLLWLLIGDNDRAHSKL